MSSNKAFCSFTLGSVAHEKSDVWNRPYLFLHLIMHYYALICYCFSHLIGLLSVTWLSVFYVISISLWRRANARNVRLYYPYWQYTDLFIFRFVSLFFVYTLRLFQGQYIKSVKQCQHANCLHAGVIARCRNKIKHV